MLLFIFPNYINKEDLNITQKAKSSIMIEDSTGEVIYIICKKCQKKKFCKRTCKKNENVILF